jgi:hypothetical protein
MPACSPARWQAGIIDHAKPFFGSLAIAKRLKKGTVWEDETRFNPEMVPAEQVLYSFGPFAAQRSAFSRLRQSGEGPVPIPGAGWYF